MPRNGGGPSPRLLRCRRQVNPPAGAPRRLHQSVLQLLPAQLALLLDLLLPPLLLALLLLWFPHLAAAGAASTHPQLPLMPLRWRRQRRWWRQRRHAALRLQRCDQGLLRRLLLLLLGLLLRRRLLLLGIAS